MISIVLYGRNDNYGYNLGKRAAIGLNCMAEVLTDAEDEILFVDYNTPDDFPTFPESIADTLTDKAKRLLRILRVRPAHHAPYAGRTHLQTIEPIARNVALRRSNPANRWVLSTNTEMIFVPRQGRSLSELVGDLPRGFYATPRFEVPESLWESWDRHDPVGIIRDVGRWGWDASLNEVVYSTGIMFQGKSSFLYDAPGDFQLLERADLFAIGGFDERMVLGWHVDSNLFRRLSLLYDGATTGDLVEQVFAYHCTHTRQLTPAHKHDAPSNDLMKSYYLVKRAKLPKQRKTWGMVEEEIEEISLQRTPTHVYLDAVKSTLEAEGVGQLSTPQGRVDYDERHVLPFLLNVFVSAPRTLSVAWVGTEPEMFRLFRAGWRAMGFTGAVRASSEFAGELGDEQIADIHVSDLYTTCMQADVVIFDFAQRRDLDEDEQAERNDRLRSALETFCRLERLRLERESAVPRRAVAINAFYNAFDRLVRESLACTMTPYCTRIRTGFVPRAVSGEGKGTKNDVLLIVPTRSRPASSSAFAEAFFAHSTRADLLFALDEDDPLLADYAGISGALYEVNPRLYTIGTLNLVANKYVDQYAYLAFMSDDYRIRSLGWDERLVEAIEDVPCGIAYGNDVAHGIVQPTAVLMRSDIVRTLGFLAPPALIHHFASRFWRDLGQMLGTLRNCEDVAIEPQFATALELGSGVQIPEPDESEVYARDVVAYDHYARTRLPLDASRLRALIVATQDPEAEVPRFDMRLRDLRAFNELGNEGEVEELRALMQGSFVDEASPTSDALATMPPEPSNWRTYLRRVLPGGARRAPHHPGSERDDYTLDGNSDASRPWATDKD